MKKNKKPQIRFKGFTNDWEQRKLGEITETYSGGTPAVNKKEFYGGDIPFIRSGEISSDKTELFITSEGLNNSSSKMINKGDILYALYGATSGEVSISKIKGAINQAILAIQPYQSYDSQFLMQWLSKSKKNIISTYLQGGQGNLSGNIVKELLVDVPTYNEQKKIGAYFEQLDNLITLHQCKCEKLKIMKKSCLEKMFPKNNQKIPDIRFKRFTNDWEQRKLGEIGSVSMCRRIFKEQTSKNGDIPFYKIGTFGGEADAYISKELFEEYKQKYPYPQKGDILISASGSIGRIIEFTGENEYFQDSNIVWLNHDERINNTFLKCFYNVVKWFGLEGSTIKRLYNDNILKTEISLPMTDEQYKISCFFENLDNLITLHQRKVEKLKKIKKSCLEKMFV